MIGILGPTRVGDVEWICDVARGVKVALEEEKASVATSEEVTITKKKKDFD